MDPGAVPRTVGTVVVVGALPLRAGAAGEAVADLQRRLDRLDHSVGEDVAGEYGPGTEAAVRTFQRQRGLREDGICGDETWSTLVDAGQRLGDRLLYERVPMLRGDDVADLQTLLGELGFDAGRVDGFFGPDTAHAVAEFQRNVGLPTDGVCGPETIEAIHRVSGRTGNGSTVARVREAEAIRRTPPGLADRRIAVADGGEATGLTDALGRALQSSGAVVTVVHHPDEGERAGAANAFDAAVCVGLSVREEPGVDVAYYAREDFESIGGRRLAEMIASALAGGPAAPQGPPRGMRLRILRETRMPAVQLEIGPPSVAVEHAPSLVRAVAEAVARWTTEPLD
jgi:N-acetylmuramoyl-L-alanine amidase